MVRSRLLGVVVTLFASCAHAGDIKGDEDPSQFGNLDQHNLSVCKTPGGTSLACGPAAAVNSFVYLEHRFPKIYGDSLVNLSGPGTPEQGQEMTGNDLGATFMGCSCDSGGTTWSKFYSGKMDYINLMDPGTTAISQDRTPGADWIADALNDGADVEILISFGTKIGHFVTVTNIDYDPILQDGTISYIDPMDGKPHTAGITGNGVSPGLAMNYKQPDGAFEDTGQISFAASEVPYSAIPEPGTWAMLLMGFAVLGVAARRRGRDGARAEA